MFSPRPTWSPLSQERPGTHYQLLGIPPNERDLAVMIGDRERR